MADGVPTAREDDPLAGLGAPTPLSFGMMTKEGHR